MKVLAYTSPARGHLFPLVPILDELTARGHGVSLRTLASQVPLMRDRGFDAKPISPAVEAIEHDDHLGKNPPARVRRAMRTFTSRAPHDAEDLQTAIDAVGPDALLVDCMTLGAAAVAERWGGPWAQWFPYPLPVSSRDVPPFGLGLPPATGMPGRIRDRVLRPLLTGTMERAALPALNETRAKLGVGPVASGDELFLAAPLLLYMTGEPFEYPRSDWPASVRLVGPCSWDPPSEAPAWLDEVEKPIVLVSTSSEFQDDAELVSTALEALAGEDVYVVATLPSAEVPARVPANARIEPFVPHAPILERAVCAITHGGAGVTMKALAAGVPVCVVPFGRDQPEVARRVEVAGAGTQIPLSKLNPERLRDAVRAATAKKDGAARVAAGFEAAGGATAAADEFERMAANAKAPLGSGA